MRQCGCTFHLIHKADVYNDDCAYPAVNQLYTQRVTKAHTVGDHRYKPNLDTEMGYCNKS